MYVINPDNEVDSMSDLGDMLITEYFKYNKTNTVVLSVEATKQTLECIVVDNDSGRSLYDYSTLVVVIGNEKIMILNSILKFDEFIGDRKLYTFNHELNKENKVINDIPSKYELTLTDHDLLDRLKEICDKCLHTTRIIPLKQLYVVYDSIALITIAISICLFGIAITILKNIPSSLSMTMPMLFMSIKSYIDQSYNCKEILQARIFLSYASATKAMQAMIIHMLLILIIQLVVLSIIVWFVL